MTPQSVPPGEPLPGVPRSICSNLTCQSVQAARRAVSVAKQVISAARRTTCLSSVGGAITSNEVRTGSRPRASLHDIVTGVSLTVTGPRRSGRRDHWFGDQEGTMNDDSPTGTASVQGSELADAVAAAVEAGIAEVDELKSVVAEVAEALDGATSRLSGSDDSSAGPNAFAELSSAAAHALVQRIEESRSVLETFNIAFFGRTGAGKSTLMSALGRPERRAGLSRRQRLDDGGRGHRLERVPALRHARHRRLGADPEPSRS